MLGSRSGRGPCLPLAVDGFAVIATLGITVPGAGSASGKRALGWVGLLFVLGLLSAGSVEHALRDMAADFPHVLAGAFDVAPPISVWCAVLIRPGA